MILKQNHFILFQIKIWLFDTPSELAIVYTFVLSEFKYRQYNYVIDHDYVKSFVCDAQ